MKKIGLLISTLNSGGAERVVSHLTHILSKSYEVHLILFEDTYMEYKYAGVFHNLNVPAKPGNVLTKLSLLRKRVSRLKKQIRQEKLACVISFLDSPNLVNLLAKVSGCRKIVSIRNYSELENRGSRLGQLTDAAMKLLYRKADHVVPVSKVIAEAYHNHYNVPREKLTAIYNPYNFEDMRQKSAEALSEKEQKFFQSGFVFANVGRIMPQKAVWHLVKAFAQVHNAHPEARLVIVGEDYTEGRLTKLIGQLQLANAILLTGRTRNPYKYMKHAQCYVLSSLFEGFPNAMVEAMACDCAVIATDCLSGPREILYDEPDLAKTVQTVTEADYGILVPPLESEENWENTPLTPAETTLAQAMCRVLEDSEKCADLAQKAAARSRAFDFDAAHRAFCGVIEG